MNNENILLKEYELLQKENHQRVTHYWIIVGVYMSVNTAILGALVVAYIAGSITCGVNSWLIFGLVLVLGAGVIGILCRLIRHQKRIDFVIYSNYERMREIETDLNMWGNWRIHGLDQWLKENFSDEVPNNMRTKLLTYHSKDWWQKWKEGKRYSEPIGAKNAKAMMYTIIALWIIFIIASLFFAISPIRYI